MIEALAEMDGLTASWPFLPIYTLSHMAMDIPTPYLRPWMFSRKYLQLMKEAFQDKFKIHKKLDNNNRPANAHEAPVTYPNPQVFVNLLSFSHIESQIPNYSDQSIEGEHIHTVWANFLARRVQINAAARFTAIFTLTDLTLEDFAERYHIVAHAAFPKNNELHKDMSAASLAKIKKAPTRIATISKIVNHSGPIKLQYAIILAQNLDFDIGWFCWDDFCKSPLPLRYFRSYEKDIKHEIWDNAKSVMSFSKRLDTAIPGIRWPRCPSWVEPYLLTAYVAEAERWSINDSRALKWPRPDDVGECNWSDILDLKTKAALKTKRN
jgi:hypothetical protein